MPDSVHSSALVGENAFIHHSALVDEEASVGSGTRIWHFAHIGRRARIGSLCTIGQNVFIADEVRVGDHCKIQNNVSVYAGVELEEYVFCGPSMVFTNVRAPRAAFPKRGAEDYEKTLVQRGASIGANATIVCGVTLGAWSFIAAGAVVNSNVPRFALMVGVPARRVGWVCGCGERLPASLACDSCRRGYADVDGHLELTSGSLP